MSKLEQKYINMLSLESKVYPYLNYNSGVLVENSLNNNSGKGFYILNNFKKLNFCLSQTSLSVFYYERSNLKKVPFIDSSWQHTKSVKDHYTYNIINTGKFLPLRNQCYSLFNIFSGFSKTSSEKYFIFTKIFNGLVVKF